MGQIGESSLYILLDNYTVTLRKFVTYSKNTHFKPTGEKTKLLSMESISKYIIYEKCYEDFWALNALS